MDAEGRPQFIEVNTLPGLSPVTGDIVWMARDLGISYGDLIHAIVVEACDRLGIH